MYCPKHFQEIRPASLIKMIEQFPLATIICNSPSGMVADHIPLMFEALPNSSGKLVGHIAKSNSLWKIPSNQEILVVFQGPSTYISPNWYATKQEAGKVVPTWNYAVVHVYCTLEAIHDPAKVMEIITALTDQQEATQPHPWSVTDAPSEFIERLVSNIVGVELKIKSMQGKWKVSQNQPVTNQKSLIHGLLADCSDAQSQMALLVQSYGAK
jgi:transcriptional regulator